MTAEPKAAPGLPARTATLELEAPYEGWVFTIRLDYPARVLEQLLSGSVVTITRALDTLVIEHNFPDVDGKVAASMLDVYPVEGVLAAFDAYQDHRLTVPNR